MIRVERVAPTRHGGPTCQVWWARASDVHTFRRRILSRSEWRRADEYRRAIDADRFLVGAALLRVVVGAHLRVSPSAVPFARSCPTCGLLHGKPRITAAPPHLVGASTESAIDFSVAHSGSHVVVAVARGARVGVDIETRRASVASNLVTAICSASEQGSAGDLGTDGLVRLWTQKEALLKAAEVGLMVEPSSFCVPPLESPGSQDRVAILALPPPLRLVALEQGDDIVGCLATAGAAVTVEERSGSDLLRDDAALHGRPVR